MGLFSWNCKHCEESIKAPYDLPKEIAWQNECVLVESDGNVISGTYDGYGGIESSVFEEVSGSPEFWHEKCWNEYGKGWEYSVPSTPAEDQGYFFKWDEETKTIIR
jgi:hypothetical protein